MQKQGIQNLLRKSPIILLIGLFALTSHAKETTPILGENLFSIQGKTKSLKVDSSRQDLKTIHWPLVYPEQYKAAINLGLQRNSFTNGTTNFGVSFGASLEFLWEQTLFYGLGYQFNTVPKTDSLEGGSIHRISANTGIIIQLDDLEKHHLLIHIRPGMSFLKAKEGNASAFGLGLGLGYDFSINSDFILAPEVIYNWYPALKDSPYGVSGWNFGLRFSFGK